MRSRQSGHHFCFAPEQTVAAREDSGEFGEDTVVESWRSLPPWVGATHQNSTGVCPDAIADLSVHQQGIQLREVSQSHAALFEKIPASARLCSAAWLLLLFLRVDQSKLSAESRPSRATSLCGILWVCQSREMGARLEVVTDGLPLFHGAQLALDATMVSALRCDGTPHRRAVEEDGAVLRAARRWKERTYPELTGRFGRVRLVVLACEVGGRMVRGKRTSWLWRWRSILACAAAKVFAQSLLEQRGGTGVDGPTPSLSEVMSDSRH